MSKNNFGDKGLEAITAFFDFVHKTNINYNILDYKELMEVDISQNEFSDISFKGLGEII